MHRLAILLLPVLAASAVEEWVPARILKDGTIRDGHWRTVRDPYALPPAADLSCPPASPPLTFTAPSRSTADCRPPPAAAPTDPQPWPTYDIWAPTPRAAPPADPQRWPTYDIWASTWVEGHYRKDGTWVEGHRRKR